jgi:hypothetical protein
MGAPSALTRRARRGPPLPAVPLRAGLLWFALLLALILPLLGPPAGASAQSPTAVAQPPTVTAQIGIAEGTVLQELAPGTTRRALEGRLPLLFRAAEEFGVRIDAASVGRGFWSEDEALQSENDLDLVATGVRENVLAFAATLGQAWEQRSVYVWFFHADGRMLTVTVPLPGGADGIGPPGWEALVAELPDGWHVRYAGAESALFVANTGAEPDEQFRERVVRVEGLLRDGGARTGPMVVRRAEMVALTTETYAEAIAGATRGKAAAR